jgi:hypothetical protein
MRSALAARRIRPPDRAASGVPRWLRGLRRRISTIHGWRQLGNLANLVLAA